MKHLIVLFDGTWNDLSMPFPTNVARLAMAMKERATDGNPQLIEYVAGLGTGSERDRIFSGALGHGIDQKTSQGYTFLANNFEAGDQIYVFGFSRGAYTARSLTGFISTCGLLKRHQVHHTHSAFQAYRKRGTRIQSDYLVRFNGEQDSHGKVRIKFLGCWDTVSSLGIPDRLESMPFDKWLNEKYAFHQNRLLADNVENAAHAVAMDEPREEFDIELMEQETQVRDQGQRLIQVWFPGDHGCVGGGTWYKRGLSNLALKWMVEDVMRDQLKLALAVDLACVIDVGPEGDALTTKIDPLIYFSTEIKPLYEALQNGRTVPRDAQFHPSVFQRKQALGSLYLHPPATEQLLASRVPGVSEGTPGKFIVLAREPRNDTHIVVQPGQRYRITIDDTQIWKDGDLEPCRVKGWKTEDLDKRSDWLNPIAWARKAIVRAGESVRKSTDHPWFCLILYTDDGDLVAVEAEDTECVFRGSGPLYACANDARVALGNNEGWLLVKMEKTD